MAHKGSPVSLNSVVLEVFLVRGGVGCELTRKHRHQSGRTELVFLSQSPRFCGHNRLGSLFSGQNHEDRDLSGLVVTRVPGPDGSPAGISFCSVLCRNRRFLSNSQTYVSFYTEELSPLLKCRLGCLSASVRKWGTLHCTQKSSRLSLQVG